MKLNNLSLNIHRSFAIACVFIGLASGCSYASHDTSATASGSKNNDGVEVAQTPAQKVSVGLPDFSEIAAQQGPAVVNISVSGSVKSGIQSFPGFSESDPNDPFYEFFRRFQVPAPQGSQPTHGLGSGVTSVTV